MYRTFSSKIATFYTRHFLAFIAKRDSRARIFVSEGLVCNSLRLTDFSRYRRKQDPLKIQLFDILSRADNL